MQMARAAGMPVPKLLCCGKHPNAPYSRTFSILMTRLPGVALENSSYQLEIDAEGPWLEELKTCVHSMRSWYPPDQSPISSPIGTLYEAHGSLITSWVLSQVRGNFMIISLVLLRAMHLNRMRNTSRRWYVPRSYNNVHIGLCLPMEISKPIISSSMMKAIYLGFWIGNPQAGILNTGSLQRQCVLDGAVGGFKLLLGLEGISTLRNWPLMSR